MMNNNERNGDHVDIIQHISLLPSKKDLSKSIRIKSRPIHKQSKAKRLKGAKSIKYLQIRSIPLNKMMNRKKINFLLSPDNVKNTKFCEEPKNNSIQTKLTE